MAIVQELSELDFTSRRNGREAFLENVPEDAIVYFSHEAHFHFHMTGCRNKQNMCYWADTSTQELHQRPLHSPKVTVWYAIYSTGIVGPRFFEENEITVTMNSEQYVNMLVEFFLP